MYLDFICYYIYLGSQTTMRCGNSRNSGVFPYLPIITLHPEMFCFCFFCLFATHASEYLNLSLTVPLLTQCFSSFTSFLLWTWFPKHLVANIIRICSAPIGYIRFFWLPSSLWILDLAIHRHLGLKYHIHHFCQLNLLLVPFSMSCFRFRLKHDSSVLLKLCWSCATWKVNLNQERQTSNICHSEQQAKLAPFFPVLCHIRKSEQ